MSHFEITGELGRGGMRTVSRATDSRLGREVALKVAWELYGLRVGESATVRIGVNRGRTSIVTRLGALLRVL